MSTKIRTLKQQDAKISQLEKICYALHNRLEALTISLKSMKIQMQKTSDVFKELLNEIQKKDQATK